METGVRAVWAVYTSVIEKIYLSRLPDLIEYFFIISETVNRPDVDCQKYDIYFARVLQFPRINAGAFRLSAMGNQSIENFMSSSPLGCDFVTSIAIMVVSAIMKTVCLVTNP